MGGHRSLLMVMVWVWIQIRRKMLGSASNQVNNSRSHAWGHCKWGWWLWEFIIKGHSKGVLRCSWCCMHPHLLHLPPFAIFYLCINTSLNIATFVVHQCFSNSNTCHMCSFVQLCLLVYCISWIFVPQPHFIILSSVNFIFIKITVSQKLDWCLMFISWPITGKK